MPKVDSKGRIVLPQELRDRFDITPGTEVVVREEDGKMVVRPEDDPDQVIERLDRLVEEAASRRGETVPTDGTDPIPRKHREAVRRGARGDGGENGDEDGTNE
jgi:AbrB family looped-hinge helix DNA binding protein